MNQYKSIFRHMLAYQRKRRLIAQARGLGADEARKSLSYTEEAVLFTLLESPGINTRDLSKALGVERSWMSRIVGSLEKRGLLSVKPSPEDKRSKEVRVSGSGEKLVWDAEALVGEVLDESLSPLSGSERKKFQKFLASFADGIGAPKYKLDGVHPTYWELWRLSRGVGISVGSFTESSLSTTQTQVLFVLKEAQGGVVLASDIESRLPFDASTVSRVLSDFESRGWIERAPLKDDRRSLSVTLTKDGVKAYQDALANGARITMSGLGKLDEGEIVEIEGILAKLVSDMNQLAFTRSSKSLPKVEKISLGELSKTARSFAIDVPAEHLKENFPSGGYVLKSGDEVYGVAALANKSGGRQLLLYGKSLSEKEMLNFVKSCLREQSAS